jgi:hypothetical protein
VIEVGAHEQNGRNLSSVRVRWLTAPLGEGSGHTQHITAKCVQRLSLHGSI